jgi:hypothetical protein
MNTAIEKAFTALVLEGQELTAKQMAARFSVANPHDLVHRIRQEGFAIYLNKTVDSKGRVKMKYRHGAPTRKLIAAGYRALALGL